ncbi:MAG TPA: hypothetical protein VD862_02830 [Candidatus Paceibacterota bacterium]|nr:hypothetical protein [Candidatus Paceibacterota bacterium]
MHEPHPDRDAKISREEVDFATESAFIQLRNLRRVDCPAEPGEAVVYQDPHGTVHPLFKVISADERTLLITGFRNGEEQPIQLRVMRGEVERMEDVSRGARRILAMTYPCKSCGAADLPPLDGRDRRTPMSH